MATYITSTSPPRMKLQPLWVLIILIILVVLLLNKDDISNIAAVKKVETESYSEKKIQAWFLRRKQLQEDPAEKKKLLLFCYMKGGSTFFGELFQVHREAFFLYASLDSLYMAIYGLKRWIFTQDIEASVSLSTPHLTFYWYEPLDAFYMSIYGLRRWAFTQDVFWHQHSEDNITLRTQYPEWELEAVSNFNRDLLTVNFTDLPMHLMLITRCVIAEANDEAMTKSCDLWKINQKGKVADKVVGKCGGNIANSMRQNCAHLLERGREVVAAGGKHGSADLPQEFVDEALCVRLYRHLFMETGCQKDLSKRYESSKLVVYKGLRHMMNSMERLFEKTPDMYILYLIRDPRAIVSSRFKHGQRFRGSHNDPVLESKFMCSKMLNDYLVYKELNAKYPGVIKLVKYEELVKDKYGVLDNMYGFLGLDVPESIIQTVNKMEKELAHKNTTSTLEKWQVNYGPEVQRGMTENCKTFLETLGYEL